MASQSSQTVQSHAANALRFRGNTSVFWFAATTLLGAFLVFQVQPVISKCVLPWFGGTPTVWTTCMLFFQVLLFLGYVYAHLLKTLFRPAIQGAIHVSLLCAAAWSLPIEPTEAWKPNGTESPTAYLLMLLAAHVGLPYFVLSSTGPLVQAWMTYRDASDRVYRLYALSNAGSLIALLSYPFLVEPALSVSTQSVVWSLLFCAFALIQGMIAIRLFRVSGVAGETVESNTAEVSPCDDQDAGGAPSWATRIAWLALPATASTVLLVTTNHVCQDVAVIPFLWVLPLSLYLLSFIICFDSPHWYQPKLIAGVTLLSLGAIQAKHLLPGSMQLVAEVSAYMTMLLGLCLLCHGEMARLRPSARRLTQYYMFLSAGGALGGLTVAVVCPAFFTTHLELPISLAFVTAISFVMFFACRGWLHAGYDWSAAYRLRFAAIVLVVTPLMAMALAPQDETIASKRNFFGVLQVLRNDQGVRLVHGSTIHGLQFLGERSSEPTSYYARHSGIGRTIASLHQRSDVMRVGVVGLGCGVLATYGRAGDEFDMIEINPAVVDIANKHFTFLSDSPSTIRTHLGDGRLVLERMDDARFDLLVLDAFSSDAIPAHLLTRQAIALYRERLAKEGVLVIHVSNNHLNLVPLVQRLSQDAGMESRVVRSHADVKLGLRHATWVTIADPDHWIWREPTLENGESADPVDLADAPLWTDQEHNLVSVLRLW